MSFFPFIESIFYLSLGIIVILIFLIVFHFKQRIESLEKKGFLLTELYNNLVKEISIMKTVVYSPPAVQQKQNIVFSTQTESNFLDLNPTYKKIIVMDKLSEEEEEEEEDEDEDSDEEEEDEEEKEFTYNDLEVIEINELSPTKEPILSEERIVLEENELESENNTINVLKLESEPEPEPETPVLPTPSNPVSVSYDKLNLNELKMLVITKGLSTNPNKLKKMELLKLLEEETV